MIEKKKKILFQQALLLFSLYAMLSVPVAQGSEKGQITIQVLGLDTDKGVVRFGLFNSKESFPKENRVIRKGAQPVTRKTCKFVIKDLDFGEYAIAVGHDKNGNGKVDRFLGFPVEPVGISGYENALWNWPTYEKAKFSLEKKSKTIKIQVF